MIEEIEKLKIHKLVHEIKNPLSICTGYLEMLPNCKKEKTNKYLDIIKKELQKSLQMIDNANENISIIKTKFNLNKLFEEIQTTLSDLYSKYNTKILYSKNNIIISADYNKLRQVFINILKNSLESKNKNNLIISIKAFNINDNCTIYITDNGKGMTKEELKNTFKPYYTTKKNGTGLGTINIKEIIELHNGTIEYLSIPNKGTTIIIKLPLD